MRKYIFACAIATLIAAPLAAQVTITTGAPAQYVGPLGKDSELGPIPTVFAQTFRVPAGTNSLQSFSFYMTNFFGGSGLLLDASVYQFQTDRLTGAALYNGQFTGTNSSAAVLMKFGSVALPLNVSLLPATTYALLFSAANRFSLTPDGSSVLLGATLNDAYANGSLFASFATTTSSLFLTNAFQAAAAPDAAFSATFVSTAVVPEPGSVVLIGTGLLLLGVVNFRRKRA